MHNYLPSNKDQTRSVDMERGAVEDSEVQEEEEEVTRSTNGNRPGATSGESARNNPSNCTPSGSKDSSVENNTSNYIPQDANAPVNRQRNLLIAAAVLVVIAGAVVGGVCGSGNCGGSDGDDAGIMEDDDDQTFLTLEAIDRRGVLRCGVTEQNGFSRVNAATGEREGFDVDLCKAVAAAVFGEAQGNVAYVVVQFADVFTTLQENTVDLLAAGVTHTMERDVFEPSSGSGFSFTTPYLYNGLGFGGLPEYVACTENVDETAELRARKLQTTEPAPISAPTPAPTSGPTEEATVAPTAEPTTKAPTVAATEPTFAPTGEPTTGPTASPSLAPSDVPSTSPTSICNKFQICTIAGSTHIGRVQELLPNAIVVQSVSSTALYRNFIDGLCQVIAGEQFEISEGEVRNNGYFGSYEVGSSLYSKEPLALVTRDGDPAWSDFVNWVIQALLAAEEQDVTKFTASVFTESIIFGEKFRNMFVDALVEVGNYGEIYERNLESMLPRPTVNTINGGDDSSGLTGLIYSHPFGSREAIQANGPSPVDGGTLRTIVQRGHLRCGITTRRLVAELDSETQEWKGFDVDFCKAVSAAIFDGVTSSIVYTDLPADQRFQALARGDVDLLSRITTHTLERDVLEPNSGEGFSYSQIDWYDGLTIGGVPPYGECAGNVDITSEECQDLKICVLQGTTFITRLEELFPPEVLVPRQDGVLNIQGISDGVCNAVAGGLLDIAASSVKEIGNYDGPYEVAPSRFSKDPCALVTRQNDPQWTAFVYWIVSGTFYADEQGITQATASRMPVVNLFGPLYAKFLRDAIGAVGSYGEIYSRNVEDEIPRSGLHLLNRNPLGPQHYPLPGL